MKKTLVSAITTALVVGAASTTFAAANPFSDVPADSWAYDAVTKLAKDGVVNGYGDGTFRGDNTITRYEMAQIVAKAMAKTDVSASDKATIDKLAAEFADELNNLGVRVDNLEKRVDNVKWTGFARYEFVGKKDDTASTVAYHKGTDGAKSNTNTVVLRLEPTLQINDNWAGHARLEYKNDQTSNTDSGDTTKFNRAWVEGNIGEVHTKLGKLPTYATQGVVMDDTVSGAEISFGKVVKTTLTAGTYKSDALITGNVLDNQGGNYSAIQFDYSPTKALSLAAGYYQFSSSAKFVDGLGNLSTDDQDKIWGVGGTYKFSDTLAADAYYAKSNLDAGDSAKAYNFELRYKGADASAPGSFGAWAAYRYVGTAATVAPTWDAVSYDNKGIEIGGNYTFDKNILLTARYFRGTRVIDTNKDVSKIYTTLDFLF